MTEMLTAVAILIILTAVAVPAIFAASRNLKLRELDDTAREIFLAAQNTLSARKADGTLASPKGSQNEGQDDLYWLFDAEAEFLLPDGAVEPVAAENHIAIWYNADSAMVLEVYYGEKNGGFASPACDWNAADIQDGLCSNGKGSGAPDLRAEKRIGYYDGGDLDRGGVEQLLPPMLEIVNKDELTVKVTVPKAAEYFSKSVSLTVTVAALDGSGVSMEFSDPYSAVDGTYELTLDSLTEEGLRFYTVCPNITPGANIRVTAKLSAPENGGTKYLSSGMWGETNSLFEKRTGDTVSVSCARHLQNLHGAFSGFAPDSAIQVRQTDNINWPTLPNYQSIRNDKITSYNGSGLELRGLNGGMFDTVSRMTLTGIRIVNPVISETGAAGALANTASGATINDCRVYAATIDPDGAGEQREDFARLEKAFTVTGGTVGGLIGYAENCTITHSFAALSRVKGNVAGGFIGRADGCTIENCYAAAENLTGGSQSAMFIGYMNGGSVEKCYAAGNLASTVGAVSGFANVTYGTGSFTGSYCAVSYNGEDGKPSGTKPAFGFADGGDGSCAYLRVKIPVHPDHAKEMSYEELKTWGSGWQSLSEARTRPYRQALDGLAYPFPGLDMPHYGSWPVQNATYIKLFDAERGGNERRMILVPAGGETTVWAENDGGADMAAKAPLDGSMIKPPALEPGRERTRLTVEAAPGKTGVTYLDLEAGGYRLRAVVVVYELQVTLTGENNTIANSTAVGTADQTGAGTIGRLTLRTSDNKGQFTAALTTKPSKDEISQEISNMRIDLEDQVTLSAGKEDFALWDKLKTGDPAVTANGDPAAGTNILEPVNGNYYPTADSNGTLTVTGAASGTATVSARWAMDETTAAKCEVKMEGARALIQAVSAVGTDGAVLAQKDGYPYYLAIRAEPNEAVSFSFTPKLFGGGGIGKYTWSISGGVLKDPVTAEKEVTEATAGEVWSYTLEGSTGWNNYTVKLEYTNDSGERSADYMTFSIYCAAKTRIEEYAAIMIGKSDGQGVLNISEEAFSASVEQINGSAGSGFEHTAELELQSWVAGANNTRVKWSYSTDNGTTWNPVTGHLGAISIYENGTPRATVQWVNDKQAYNGVSTGGAIKITGLDVNEYDNEFTFMLRSEAAEVIKNGDAEVAARTVIVKVMNKLQITPQTYTGYSNRDIALSANRKDKSETGWAYDWQIDSRESTTFPERAADAPNITFRVTAAGERRVTLNYGPHTETATLRAVGGNYELLRTVNWDAQKNGNDYFLVEKDDRKEMTNSWFVGNIIGGYRARMTEEPSADLSIATIVVNQASSTGLGTVVPQTGQRYYTVEGKTFGTQDMVWTYDTGTYILGWYNPLRTYDYTVKLAVVGMDITKDGEVLSGTDKALELKMNTPTAITADWSFPPELIDPEAHPDGKPDIQWEISDTELVGFADGRNTGESVSLTAKKYSATDYTAAVTATCTVHCVNGRTYTYKKHISVSVPPATGMTTTVEPCAAVDIAGLNSAFGDGLTSARLPAAVDKDGTPVLIRDETFGCDTLYLKLRASLDNGKYANLNDYLCNLYIDRSFVDMDTVLSSDGTTMYVRLRAREAMADVRELELSAAIGSAPAVTQPIDLYTRPEITLTRDGADVTNGSIPVYQDQTAFSVTLRAALTPVIYRADDTAKATPLDQIMWYLQAPDGYDAQSYLELSTDQEGQAAVSIRDPDRMPDFRVVLHARSDRAAESDAGYALVFLPIKQGDDTP